MAEKCDKCDGCGYVADTENQEPWTEWLKLPLGSSIAVIMGIVQKIECPRCGGDGFEPEGE